MSVDYSAIGWNRQKRIYDTVLWSGVVTYVVLFVVVGAAIHPATTLETQLLRALGTCALLLLHLVLSIGPLARLDSRFLPLLYNRRHLGVTTFLVAAGHGGLAIVQFHALGDLNPLVSVLTSNGRYDSVTQFPFQPLGLLALVVLFLLAATSHDFWLENLTAPIWKALHMLVYGAYGLLVLHVALGALQDDTSIFPAALLAAGMIWLTTLHVVAGRRERGVDVEQASGGDGDGDGFMDVCALSQIEDSRARIVTLSGERVAVFRYDGKLAAVSNVCQHQNGPLGEGRIIDGCITCPWHGYQYRPEDGTSPPPFEEKIPTFRVRLRGDRVMVHPEPQAPGTPLEPASCSAVDPSEPEGRT